MSTRRSCESSHSKVSAGEREPADEAPKDGQSPATADHSSGSPTRACRSRRLNLRVASMMLAGALGCTLNDEEASSVRHTEAAWRWSCEQARRRRVTRATWISFCAATLDRSSRTSTSALAEDYEGVLLRARRAAATGAAPPRPQGPGQGGIPYEAVHDDRRRGRARGGRRR